MQAIRRLPIKCKVIAVIVNNHLVKLEIAVLLYENFNCKYTLLSCI